MGEKTGNKAPADLSPLELPNSRKNSKRFTQFCRKFVVIRDDRAGKTVKPLRLAPWQVEFYAEIFDRVAQPRLAALIVGRGNSKTTTSAAICLYHLLAGTFNENICLIASTEAQAFIAFEICKFMVTNSPELAKRCTIYKDRILCPGTQSTLRVLPSNADGLEGLDFSLCLLDESQVVDPAVFEVLNDSQGKRPNSTLLLLGTPGLSEDSPLARVRAHCLENPNDALAVLVEHSADAWKTHDLTCRHCWEAANPGLASGIVAEDGLMNALPPKSTEARFRRVRLAQWIPAGVGETYVDAAAWDALEDDNRVILPGEPIVVGLDGSITGDHTAVVAMSVDPDRPILEVLAHFVPDPNNPDSRVEQAEVEAIIRAAADIYSVRECVADPFRYEYVLQNLERAGLPIIRMPNTNARMAPAVQSFRNAVYEQGISHNGDKRLREHMLNAVIVDLGNRGMTIGKASRKRKIDLCAASVFAYERARWHATQRPKRRKLMVF